ncbi:hypothetical protein ACHWQZ_G010735 [Mnemiopsis leidyi]
MNGFFQEIGGLFLTALPATGQIMLEKENNVSRTVMRSYTGVETTAMGFFTLLCVVGITMNILVISAFLRCKLYKSPSNLQLFSLAIDDCGTALLVEPLVIVSYLKPDLFLENPWICRSFSSLLHIFPWGSTISILILSLTKVLIVMYPQMHRSYITCKHIYIALCIKYLFLVSFVGVSNFFWDIRFSMVYKQCFVSYVVGPKNDIIGEDLGDKMTLPILHMIGGLIIFIINALPICNPVIYIIRRPEYRFHDKTAHRPPAVRYNVRQEKGKFYKTARALINSRRFVDQIQKSERDTPRENSNMAKEESIKLWWNLQVAAQLDLTVSD